MFGRKNELFIVLKCANVLLKAILGRAIHMHASPRNDGIFCRYVFDGNSWTLLGRCVDQYLRKGSCFVGFSTDGADSLPADAIARGNTADIRGVRYHEYDFVYLKPREEDVSRIVQIRVIRGGRARVSPMIRGAPDGGFGEVCLLSDSLNAFADRPIASAV